MSRSSLVAALAAFWMATAVTAAPMADAELDARAHALAQQLRCVVCQNQTLADSNAELAVDLRRQIRQQLAIGADEQAVKDYLVQRYGDFVLYKPPLRPLTWALWFGPLLLLIVVCVALVRARRKASRDATPGLDAHERQKLDALLHAAAKEPPP